MVELDKPIYMGLSILDYSKIRMYSFYYDVLKPKYNDKIQLAYTDTDSFIIHVETDDICTDFKHINQHMDFQIILKIMNVIMLLIKRFLGK